MWQNDSYSETCDVSDELTPALPLIGRAPDRACSEATRRRRAALNVRQISCLMLLGIVAVYIAATAARIYARQYYVFLPDYVRRCFVAPAASAARPGPTHIFFLFVDHFEPDWDTERVARWADRYRKLAVRHHDSVGRVPQHTWFYPGEQLDPTILAILQRLTLDGFGEVELHYHHEGDTAETLAPSLRYSIAEFQAFGFLKTVTGRTAFAFVHGNEGLDNADGEYCGVNNELRLLHSLGCLPRVPAAVGERHLRRARR